MLNIDTFGEIMDEFLKKEYVTMLIQLPEGTLEAEVKDNIGGGSVMQFYFLLQAFEAVGKRMKKDMELTGEGWKEVVNNLADMIKEDLWEVE